MSNALGRKMRRCDNHRKDSQPDYVSKHFHVLIMPEIGEIS